MKVIKLSVRFKKLRKSQRMYTEIRNQEIHLIYQILTFKYLQQANYNIRIHKNFNKINKIFKLIKYTFKMQVANMDSNYTKKNAMSMDKIVLII
jgi:hypothetical protein